ncbi:MAG: toxin-antitoxin system YwqK family antitoxin [Bacteroidetes bacterium]|nr:toxin-antitoxin system YwqK family antitoxin [Bacteroidota bacterium]
MKGFSILMLMGLFACTPHEDEKTSISPRPVPSKWVEATDTQLSQHQDTLFYNNEKFSGHLFQLYPAADTALVISFIEGLQEGITRKWYDNGQLSEERLYVAGKKEGVHKAWWQDGKPKFAFEVSDDAYTGELKEWYSSGQLAKQFHYRKGQEEGSQKMWWADGSIRANYVVRNGKKYGSIGVKLCLNPYDSLSKK